MQELTSKRVLRYVTIQRTRPQMYSERDRRLILTSQEDEKIVFTDHLMNMLSVGLPTGHRPPPPGGA
jgi:hypothetical protein